MTPPTGKPLLYRKCKEKDALCQARLVPEGGGGLSCPRVLLGASPLSPLLFAAAFLPRGATRHPPTAGEAAGERG